MMETTSDTRFAMLISRGVLPSRFRLARWVVSATIASLMVTWCNAQQAGNLIPNGGFEDGGTGHDPPR